LAIGPTILLL